MNITVKDLLMLAYISVIKFADGIQNQSLMFMTIVMAFRLLIWKKPMINWRRQPKPLRKSSLKVKQVLLVGTKRQAQEPIRELAAATNMPFSVNRWMGGTLTNFETVSTSLTKYKKVSRMEEDGSLDKLPGKEGAAVKRANG